MICPNLCRLVTNKKNTHNFEGSILIVDPDHVFLHDRQGGGDNEQGNSAAESQRPSGRGDGPGLVEVEALRTLVHEEEHFSTKDDHGIQFTERAERQ